MNKREFLNMLVSGAVAAPVAALVSAKKEIPANQNKQESVYDRVMRTGKIRCGYLPWTGFIDIDPNTGTMSGITYDYMNALAKNLSLELEWVEEVGRGDYIAALEADRFDAYCTVVAWNAERARQADFIRPIGFEIFNAYVRADDLRFDYDLSRIDQKDIRIASVEGDIFTKIARNEFPNAKLIEIPQLSGDVASFEYVASGKADVVFNGAQVGIEYNKNNPEKIRKVALKKTFRRSPASISVRGGEFRFYRMLDVATAEILENGTVDDILDKYDPDYELYLRADAYNVEEQ